MISAFLASVPERIHRTGIGSHRLRTTTRDFQHDQGSKGLFAVHLPTIFVRRLVPFDPDVIKTACLSLSSALARSRISFKGQFPRRTRNNIFLNNNNSCRRSRLNFQEIRGDEE